MNHRLLVVSPTPFLPSDAGNRVRIGNLLSALREEGIDLYFLHVTREPGDAERMAAWLGHGHFRSIAYRRPARSESRTDRIRRHLRQLIDKDARHVWGIDDWYDPAITEAVSLWHQEAGFQTVIVEYVFFSKLFESLPKSVLKILDTHDRFALRHRLYLAQGMSPRFFSTTMEGEARGLSRADLILAIQDCEREAFERMTRNPVITLGHLVRIDNCLSPRLGNDPPTLLVVGSANEINVDGLNRFVASDWPAIKIRLPNARLLIAGGLGKSAPDRPDITRLGFVDDIPQAYRQAQIVINPVRSGTGLNIKSIEALGFGMPLVATTAGSRGLESEIGQSFLVADDPEAIADAVERICRHPDEAQRLSQMAITFAQQWNRRILAELKSRIAHA